MVTFHKFDKIEFILQPQKNTITEKIQKLRELYKDTNGILFIVTHESEQNVFSCRFYKVDEDVLINTVMSDGITCFEHIKDLKINENFIEKVETLIEMFEKNETYTELEAINEVLSSIIKTYKKTGKLAESDIEWINKIYKEYTI